MMLIGHFDLVTDKLRGALRTLSGCLPKKMYVYGAYGEMWSENESKPGVVTDVWEVVDFGELLDGGGE